MAQAAPRRHDLDALRACAMLLGIAYHIALSFAAGFPWLIQDSHQNEGFTTFQYLVHGFRMPLFFLISGFFTAMLWRRRGLKSLVWHRFRRILLPCLLGLITVVPVMFVVAGIAIKFGSQNQARPTEEGTEVEGIWEVVTRGDTGTLESLLANGADVDQKHPQWGITPLTLATLANKPDVAEILLQQDADVDARNTDGGTPLHAAAFLGRAEVAGTLLRHGADINARNARGDKPMDAAMVDWQMTQLIAGMMRIPVDREQVEAGRIEVIEQLRAQGGEGGPAEATQPATDKPPATKPAEILGAITLGLFLFPIFHHLWFLWFLWWLVLAFSVYFMVADWRGWGGAPKWLVLSPTRLLWLVPLTMLFQWRMGLTNAGFGPDTSVGLVPMPHVFLYYGIFFGFGILYYDADDTTGRVGGGWRWSLPISLLLVFPLGLELCTGRFGFGKSLALGEWERFTAVGFQVLYAWLMTFACMGLFRSLLTRENKTIRWLSDSSYWLYIIHLPLVILAQLWIRDWPVAGTIKFILVNAVIIGFLLLTYQWMVRYTWLGTLLNGRRTRTSKGQPKSAPAEGPVS